MSAEPKRASEWTIHGERVVDDTRRAVLSIADVELPDGVRFEQYVLRVPGAAMVIVLDDDERVLMMWRHRFIVERWVWELPGGYLDPDEEPMACAAREVEEETGWRPSAMQKLITFQPMVGTIDQENMVYLARGAEYTGADPDINEAERIGWIPLSEVQQHIEDGTIVGAGSISGLLAVLLLKATGSSRSPAARRAPARRSLAPPVGRHASTSDPPAPPGSRLARAEFSPSAASTASTPTRAASSGSPLWAWDTASRTRLNWRPRAYWRPSMSSDRAANRCAMSPRPSAVKQCPNFAAKYDSSK